MDCSLELKGLKIMQLLGQNREPTSSGTMMFLLLPHSFRRLLDRSLISVMWHTLAEEQNQHFNRICQFWGENQPKKMQMDAEANDPQPKQERLRTRWTAALDKIFADIVVEQIRIGNRTNNVFDKKTWNQIREEFNRQTNLNFNNNQLRKHLDVLRTRYHNLQSAVNQNDAMQDPCYMGFDLWEDFGAQSKTEPTKTKECPIYEQLCTIFADSGVDGKYAQSSHYEELGKSGGTDHPVPEGGNLRPKNPSSSKNVHGTESSPQNMNTADKKRKRPSELVSVSVQNNWNQELSDAMAKAITEVIASSRLRTATLPLIDKKFTITKCIKALDELEGIEDGLYYGALDLFENPNFRETFLSLKSNYVRLTWLQGKLQSRCGNYTPLRIAF
ncbi:L10-interacting MYB domain-containing protein [Abeliophyllum distichum]|uniref:L10-interacting MYB domain-containing protein n=1 Tax=Abeliophyllum distichum TaxID=126358 RepID=A0ABD1SVG9_9LAMI